MAMSACHEHCVYMLCIGLLLLEPWSVRPIWPALVCPSVRPWWPSGIRRWARSSCKWWRPRACGWQSKVASDVWPQVLDRCVKLWLQCRSVMTKVAGSANASWPLWMGPSGAFSLDENNLDASPVRIQGWRIRWALVLCHWQTMSGWFENGRDKMSKSSIRQR